MKIIKAPSRIEILSGKEKKIEAFLKGTSVKKEKVLNWVLENGIGVINKKTGVYSAPKVTKDRTEFVKIYSVFDPSIEHRLKIFVKAPEFKIKPTFGLNVCSRQEIQFDVHFGGNEKNLHWRIEEHNRKKGNIIFNKGLYKAPNKIESRQKVKIKARDLNTGKEDVVEVTLIPIAFITYKQDDIIAGIEKEIQLNIETVYDLNGSENFTCKIISKPKIGQVIDGGIYTVPDKVEKIEVVEVEATSKVDNMKKVRFLFTIFPLCPKCRSNPLDQYNRCIKCGEIIKEIKEKRCPWCSSLRWDGKICKRCNYPKRKKSLFF